jgi:23S rRNA (cytosine1962-C5)-methyltransferase
LYRDPSIEAFRIVHGEGEGLGGLDVEWLGGYAVVWVKEDAGAGASMAIMDALAPFRPRGIYLKVRPKQASRLESEASLFSAHVQKGIDAPDPHWVREGDLYYGLRLGEGLGTGLFLDQRANRAWLSAHSRGKRVLNLFAYTCSFTVAAAAGGSSSTVSVDISKRGLEEGAHNLRRNGFSEKNNELICDDVQRWLNQACRKKIQFDIVVFDPPSFGTSPHGRFVATRDYIDLASQCMKLIAPRGWLLACTNRRVITKTKLRNWLERGAKDAGRSIVSWRDVSAGQDFPHWVGGEPHMKAMLCGL